jgi:uncharacterized SAM-binding protein YcdF (DUF218 family)
MRRRVALALAVARDLPRVTFVPIGGEGRHGPAEALVMAKLLEQHGVHPAAIHPVPEGATTIHSLAACWPFLRRRSRQGGARAVHVCTDGYHVRRCRLILRIWGLESVAPVVDGGSLDAAALPGPSPWRLAWMTLRDGLALCEDVPLALLWRLQRRLEPARRARPEP